MEFLFAVKEHKDVIHSICFHPYKNILVSLGRQGNVNIWDLEPTSSNFKESIFSTQIDNCIAGNSIMFSKDGKKLALGSNKEIKEINELLIYFS